MRSALSPLEPQQVRAPFGLGLDGERLDRSGETLGLTSKFKGGTRITRMQRIHAESFLARRNLFAQEKKTAFCPCGGGLVAARNHPPNPRNRRPPLNLDACLRVPNSPKS